MAVSRKSNVLPKREAVCTCTMPGEADAAYQTMLPRAQPSASRSSERDERTILPSKMMMGYTALMVDIGYLYSDVSSGEGRI